MTIQGLILCSGIAFRAVYDHCFVDTTQQRESIDAERDKSCLFVVMALDRIRGERRVLYRSRNASALSRAKL